MTDSTTEGLKDVEPWIWEFVKAVFPEAPHLAVSSFDERHALETATTTIADQRATIEALKLELDVWTSRTAAALFLVPPGTVVGELRQVERRLKAKRDELQARCDEQAQIIGELTERNRTQAQALEALYRGEQVPK